VKYSRLTRQRQVVPTFKSGKNDLDGFFSQSPHQLHVFLGFEPRAAKKPGRFSDILKA
jgi:hypothetical protein